MKNFAIARSADSPNHVPPEEPYPFTSINAAHILLCVMLALAAIQPLRLAAGPLLPQPDVATHEVDPNKAASEMNHHIAGVLLIAIGLSVIGSGYSQSLAWLRWLTPILFIAAGLFLAAWSDAEMWPRGTRDWSWLFHHDVEALQHKLYALLLIVLGVVEAVQASSKRRPWLSVVFPILCVIGAASLFFHHHHADVAVNVVAPLPLAPSSASHQPVLPVAYAPEHAHGSAGSASEHMEHAGAGGTSPEPHHDHHLVGPAARIQREHAWFAVVGFLVALFKFLYDAARPPARVRRYLWASSVMLLGLLLLLYTE